MKEAPSFELEQVGKLTNCFIRLMHIQDAILDGADGHPASVAVFKDKRTEETVTVNDVFVTGMQKVVTSLHDDITPSKEGRTDLFGQAYTRAKQKYEYFLKGQA